MANEGGVVEREESLRAFSRECGIKVWPAHQFGSEAVALSRLILVRRSGTQARPGQAF